MTFNSVAMWKGITQGVNTRGQGFQGLSWRLATVLVNLPILGWTDDYAAQQGIRYIETTCMFCLNSTHNRKTSFTGVC